MEVEDVGVVVAVVAAVARVAPRLCLCIGPYRSSSTPKHGSTTGVLVSRCACSRVSDRLRIREFVTGFHKRKLSRQEKAEQLAKEQLRKARVEARKQVCLPRTSLRQRSA